MQYTTSSFHGGFLNIKLQFPYSNNAARLIHRIEIYFGETRELSVLKGEINDGI